MPRLSALAARDLMDELASDNPPPEERWLTWHDFDPPLRIWEVEALRRQGLIEFERPGDDREEWRFRFTKEGRLVHAALKEGA